MNVDVPAVSNVPEAEKYNLFAFKKLVLPVITVPET